MIRILAALVALSLANASRAADGSRVDHVELVLTSIDGCAGIPFPPASRELVIDGAFAVDRKAHFWELDRPVSFEHRRASRRYRVGNGVLSVESELSPELDRETVRMWISEPIADEYLAIYLPGTRFPCERIARYTVRRLEPVPADLATLARFDAALLEATELVYDARHSEADVRLREAMTLRPEDPAPYWMMARLLYLSLESRAPKLSSSERIAGYEAAESWADQAVARAPARAEGYLWQSIARGRIATSTGALRLAVRGWTGGRGPSWLETTMRKAVSLPEDFHFFGFSTRGDALHTLAQFYRLAPTGWYMSFVGTSGNLDRAIELSRESVALQPVRIEYRKELAVELICRGADGDAAEARAQLDAAAAIPEITPIDRIDHTHARALLRQEPGVTCGYSRDAFREPAT